MAQYYSYIKAVHIVFVISWMAGLFYIVRIFVYQTEANLRAEPAKSILVEEYKRNGARLFNIITTPAMVIALSAGITMFSINHGLLHTSWMQVKIGLVLCLLAYHFYCGYMLKQLKNNRYTLSSLQLRMFNEGATLLMVSIVFVVILKNAFSWLFGVIGFIALGVTLMLAVKAYKYFRTKSAQK